MGSRQSSMSKNENSVYKILEADENTTPAQIKQNYIRLLRKHHPDYGKEKDIEKTQQIIAAYTKLKEKNFQVLTMELFENINFRRYSLVYFQRLDGLAFFTEVNKIYRTIEKNESLYFENGKYPKFGDDGSKIEAINRFYSFYKNFKTNVRFERTINNKNIFDKNYDKEERRIYNENIRNLTHSIYLCDYRIKKNVFESVITVVTKKEEKVKFKKKKDIGEYAFYCDACKKGFMSDKTMISHLKSEKHKTKATELGLEDRSIEEIMSEATIENDTKESSSDSFVEEKVEIMKDEQDIEEKMTEHAQEDEIADVKKLDEINKVTNKIINLKIKSAKSKGTKKKPVNHKDKENVQMLTCANCKTTFESRNKLFAHIKSQHLAKHDKNE